MPLVLNDNTVPDLLPLSFDNSNHVGILQRIYGDLLDTLSRCQDGMSEGLFVRIDLDGLHKFMHGRSKYPKADCDQTAVDRLSSCYLEYRGRHQSSNASTDSLLRRSNRNAFAVAKHPLIPTSDGQLNLAPCASR